MHRLAQLLTVVIALVYTGFALLSGGDLVHNYPNALPWFLVWLAVPVAWYAPHRGGFLFIALGVAATFFFHSYESLVAFVLVSLPLFVVGGLLLCAPPTRRRRRLFRRHYL